MFSLVGCSMFGGKKADKAAAGEGMNEDADFIVDAEDEGDLEEASSLDGEENELEEEVADDGSKVVIDGDVASYTVKRNDTLMFIAFKLYGDYAKWREIKRANPGLSSTKLTVGSVIKYQEAATKFAWRPQGEAYLIKRGDTLGTISSDVYGVSSKWKKIYRNNRPMIKNPNLIFAGFTLYYVPEGSLAYNQ